MAKSYLFCLAFMMQVRTSLAMLKFSLFSLAGMGASTVPGKAVEIHVVGFPVAVEDAETTVFFIIGETPQGWRKGSRVINREPPGSVLISRSPTFAVLWLGSYCFSRRCGTSSAPEGKKICRKKCPF